jgi:hypothetical protein
MDINSKKSARKRSKQNNVFNFLNNSFSGLIYVQSMYVYRLKRSYVLLSRPADVLRPADLPTEEY